MTQAQTLAGKTALSRCRSKRHVTVIEPSFGLRCGTFDVFLKVFVLKDDDTSSSANELGDAAQVRKDP
jgi:hypothetical protein